MDALVDRLIPRHAQSIVETALADTRIALINGPRQAGKSTLAGIIASRVSGAEYRSLDQPQWLSAAREDPTSFVRHDRLLVIDEIQRAPHLFLPLKYEVDADPRPGRYLLTGSARILGLKQLPDALPGRMETIELWPLSQGEIEGRRDGFVEAVFALPHERLPDLPVVDRSEVASRIIRGGFPDAVRRGDDRRRTRLLAGYVADMIDRDIRELADIGRGDELRRMLRLAAARTGQLLVASELANDLSVSGRTVLRYLELCEEIFLIKRVPAWSSNLAKRAISSPKVAFVDSAIAAYLLGQNAPRLSSLTSPMIGPLMEGFVMMEIARQLTWAGEEIRLFHYRSKDNVEVDAVLETNDGRIAAIEVKASATVTAADFRGLRHLQTRTGESFACGVVLYTGRDSLSFGQRLKALPVSALWNL
ncbi:MAG TPA: ATP-binding protein [Mycobacterium sp.]|nr:ATP-binding protein [Mycobacterium sp.]